jgi:dihydrodipicolinate synthase/N-acetylneuraminate lyase
MIRGSLVPNITFFDAQGGLDLEKTRWHMHWMFDKGVDGLFLTGSYGAGPMMTNAERIQVFEIAKQVASGFKGRVLIPHVGCIDTQSTLELAIAAEHIGVDGIAAVPPFYYKHAEDLILRFYKDIVDAVSIPVYAYNNPETSRFTFTLNTVYKLQEMGLAGLKDSPVEVGFLSSVFYDAKVKQKPFEIILGTSKGWLPYYFMGSRAMIAGMNNWAPEVIALLVKATFEEDFARAEKAYLVMMELSRKMHFTDSTIASHMGLYARKYHGGYPRLPMALPPFESAKYLEIREIIRKGFDELDIELEMGDDPTIP